MKSDDIPTKIIKEFGILFAEFLWKNFNSCFETCSFPEDLKRAEVVPIYNKNNKMDESNCRLISLLSNISNVPERCMQEQLDEYLSNLLSKYQLHFRKGYGTQNYLLAMIEKLRKIKDEKSIFAAVFVFTIIGTTRAMLMIPLLTLTSRILLKLLNF